jgi:hypothetical protein
MAIRPRRPAGCGAVNMGTDSIRFKGEQRRGSKATASAYI